MGVLYHDYEHVALARRQERDVHALTGVGNTFAAGRLSYIFGLQGPALSVDTACSASLVSIHLACQSLRRHESNLALAGGVNLIMA
jgi:acyl transferase domain-containing protein